MVAPVDTGFARWLREPALYTSWANAGLAAGLLPAALETEIISPFATKAGADNEAARQGAFLGGPLALDRHIIKGQRGDLIGQPITLTYAGLGYDAGIICFVLEAQEMDQNLTALIVARKLI